MSTSNGHHRFHSLGNVPFSWENSPGISKVAPRADDDGSPVAALDSPKIDLPPPPCTDDMPRRRPVGRHSIHVPLPPVPFQPTGIRHAVPLKRDDDPFLAAYMECTKSVKKKEGKRSCKYSGKEGVKGSSWGLSCKQGLAGGVREDGIVRVSQAQVREKLLLERSQSHGHHR